MSKRILTAEVAREIRDSLKNDIIVTTNTVKEKAIKLGYTIEPGVRWNANLFRNKEWRKIDYIRYNNQKKLIPIWTHNKTFCDLNAEAIRVSKEAGQVKPTTILSTLAQIDGLISAALTELETDGPVRIQLGVANDPAHILLSPVIKTLAGIICNLKSFRIQRDSVGFMVTPVKK